MARVLDNSVLTSFVKAIDNSSKTKSESTAYGTVIILNDSKYVKMDGSDILTPVSSTVNTNDGDRVTVLIKNHTATITGNLTSPAANSSDIENIDNKIIICSNLIADKASIGDLKAASARIDILVADNVTIKENLNANTATIDQIVSKNVEITGKLNANEASIKKLEVEKISGTEADLKYATITELDVQKGNITNLQSDYANIKSLLAGEAGVGDLTTININSKNAIIENSIIRNAVMESVSISDLLAGVISTNKFHIVSDDGGVDISKSTQLFRDQNGIVRIQIGRDKNDDFTFSLFDKTGTGVLIDSTGIKPGAVADGLIVDDMVNDDANINAKKLDIKSLFKEVNDSEEVIKSNRIWLDGENQTLNQVYESLKTSVDSMTGTITDIRTGIDGLTASITETKESVNGVIENGLVYNVTYKTNEDNTTTLTAAVYKDGKNVTKDYPERWYTWRKKTESEESFLGYGYEITVPNDDYEYSGVVVGRFSTYRDVNPAALQGGLVVGGRNLIVSTEV